MNRFYGRVGAVVLMMVVGIAPARAEVAVPISDAVAQLQDSDLPILLPSRVPMDEVFLDVEVERDRYYVGFDFRPGCHSATACHFGEVMAEQGGSISAPEGAESVTLADGTAATFFSTCGAHCTASVQWRHSDVVYRVMVKNGDREGTVALANSALLGGDRRSNSRAETRSNSRTEPSFNGAVRLTARDASSPINIRASASTSAEVLHYGYAGDEVDVLTRADGTDGYVWYNIRFPQSGATGWVRGDFVTQ